MQNLSTFLIYLFGEKTVVFKHFQTPALSCLGCWICPVTVQNRGKDEH